MSTEVLTLSLLLAGAMVLFVLGRPRVDLVALSLALALVATGVLTPAQALAGFSSPAVITVAAVFVLSGALERTGFGARIGRRLSRLGGGSEPRMVAAIVLVSGLLSGFMNNVGVAALLLPVVTDLARRSGVSPSRLLIPLSFGCLVGGTWTLIGTPPNLLVAEELARHGGHRLGLFEFAPAGLPLLVIAVAYMALVGRRLLPVRVPGELAPPREQERSEAFRLEERLSILEVPVGSALAGKRLAEARLGSGFGVQVLARTSAGRTTAAPAPDEVLRGGDRLVVEGRIDGLVELSRWRHLVRCDDGAAEELLASDGEAVVAELRLGEDRERATLGDLVAEASEPVFAWGVWLRGHVTPESLHERVLRPGDRLLVVGVAEALAPDELPSGFAIVRRSDRREIDRLRALGEGAWAVQIPAGSFLLGKTPVAIRALDAFGLRVGGHLREGRDLGIAPLKPDDLLIVEGDAARAALLQALQEFGVVREFRSGLAGIEDDDVALAEAVVAPDGVLAGRSARALDFRRRWGANLVAVRRRDRVLRTNVGDLVLAPGDALLLHGNRSRLRSLASGRDLVVVAGSIAERSREGRAPMAAGIMAAVVLAVLSGWLPIAIAAPAGALAVVALRCLTVDEAYASISWKIVVLIGSMLSVGVALEETGAAGSVAEFALGIAAPHGTVAVLAALCITTALAAQVMPTAAAAVLMAPVALRVATDLGHSPKAFLIAIALAASCNFLTPVGHAANILVMGPGGYRFADFARAGAPLFVLLLIAIVFLVPLVYSL